MIPPEFQAVVMAGGKGSRMTELTACKLKCLLPICNHPMIWYPLQMLERFGFRDAIIISQESARVELQNILDRYKFNIQCEVVGVPNDEDWGTADSLRHIHDKIKRDIIVVSCDLVTNIIPMKAVNIFRKYDASLVGVFFPSLSEVASTPGPKAKHRPERDLVGVDPATSRLVFLASASDFEDSVQFPRAMLKKHQRLSLYSRLVDSHLYILRKWVVDFLAHERTISTIKGELLPYVVKKQLSKRLNLMSDQTAISERAGEDESIVNSSCNKKDIFQFAQEDDETLRIRQMSVWNDHSNDVSPAFHGDSIRCYADLVPETTDNKDSSKKPFGIRANTLANYCAINQMVLREWKEITGGKDLPRISSTSVVKSTQVDEHCMIGDDTKVSEKTSLKACVIGSRCVIEEKVRLANCIVMDGVHIHSGSSLQGCVICDDADIGNNSDLKECLVGSGHQVRAGAKHSNEVLTDVDRLMEI
ncbi:translation initiation factor eIF-2B subunit gamma [Ischnura elegans]|uniref:translation initiation factor eIF-2B subunit gamma n=1 Tax=Ischnura elegans TaxID=197161 RepID=UPI001ED89D11|nr:translation initiation factor eIF-2B subunit gamma [Ischnura elegans]